MDDVHQNWWSHVMLLESICLSLSQSFSLRVQSERTNSWFPKLFWEILLFLNIFATATSKWEQSFSKIIFSFLGVVKYRNCLDASPLLTLGWNLPSKSWLHAYWWQCIKKLFNSCKQIAPAIVTCVLLFALPTIFAIQNSLSPLVQKESDCKVKP